MGSVLFLISFHITRFFLNLAFATSAVITLCILAVFSIVGLFKLRWEIGPLPKGFFWAFAASLVALVVFPGACWDQGHHIPAVQDLMANIHPLHIAKGLRPGVTGGFYHYGSEALTAVAILISGGGSAKLVFKMVELLAGAAGFWLLYALIKAHFSDEAAVPGTMIFFWAGNFFVLMNLKGLFAGSGWHDVPKMVFYGEFAKGATPFPGYFFHLFHPPMALGFPILLVALWLILRGGKARALLSGLLLGPVALANMALAVTLLGVLLLYPIMKRLIAKELNPIDHHLSLVAALLSCLIIGLPFLLFRNAGPALQFGPYWMLTLDLQHNAPYLLFAPLIFLGIPLFLAGPGFLLAFRTEKVERKGLAMFASLSIIGLLTPHFFGTHDFVKMFMVGSLGYSPLAGLVLARLWNKGWTWRMLAGISVFGMALSPLAFYIFRWMSLTHSAPFEFD